MHRQYAINLRDGRVVLCTRETLTNIDYYAISEKVARAIENGILDRKEVVAKVKGKLLTSQEEWDALLTKKTTQNVRHSDIKPEDAEKSETRIEKEDVTSEFDMEIPADGDDAGDGEADGEPAPKSAKKGAKKGGKKGGKKDQPPADGDDAGDGEADGEDEEETPPADNGGVNV